MRILLLSLLLTSCGMSEGLNKNCGSDIEMGCNLVFGTKDKDQDSAINDTAVKNAEQDAKIKYIQDSNTQLISTINALSSQLEQVSNTSAGQISYLEDMIDTLENTVDANVLTIQALSTNAQGSVLKIIDVCGDLPGYFDEVVLKTSSGKYVAYFEDGGRRFLTELSNGTYESTDKQKCNFTVSGTELTHAVGATVRID